MAGNGNGYSGTSHSGSENPKNVFENYPILRYLFPLALGIVIGYKWRNLLIGHEPVFLIASASFAGVMALLSFFKPVEIEKYWFGIVANLFFLAFGGYLILRSVHATPCSWPEEQIVCEGIVYDSPKVYDKIVKMPVRVTSFYTGEKSHSVSRIVEFTTMRLPFSEVLKTGDGIRFYGLVKTPSNPGNPYEPDYASHLLRAGVSGQVFVYNGKTFCLDESETKKIKQENLDMAERIVLGAKVIRDRLQQKYARSGMNGESLAILSAMTLGDKHLLKRSTKELFSATGVSHVLALSGLHLGIIYGILQLLLTFGGYARKMRKSSQIIIIAFVWVYAFIAGLPASLIRAAIMYSLVSLAVVVGRKAVTLNNLFVAAFVMLAVNPLSLFDIGFQLSFMSVLFILLFTRKITPLSVYRRPVAGKLWGMVAVSVCAQVGVAPLVAYYFHQFPVYFIISNLIVVPAAFILVTGGLVYLAFYWLAPVASSVISLLDWLLAQMLQVLDAINDLPFSSLWLYPSLPAVLLLYFSFCLFVLFFYKRKSFVFALGAIGLLLAVTYEYFENVKERNVAGIYFYKGISCPVTHFVASNAESYIYVPSRYNDSTAINATKNISLNFWRRCGVSLPQRLTSGFSSPLVSRKDCVIQFGRQRICMLDTAVSKLMTPGKIQVETIYVMRGFKGDISSWVRQMQPHRVVLDEGLSDFRRREIVGKCANAKVECYDMKDKGALKLSAY